MPTATAIFASDIHLSQTAPSYRAEEPDWYAAQARPLRELRQLSTKLKAPVIIAGDIFDHWKAPPELINFAIQQMPKCYAVPGQHDLPNHNYDDIEKSAYWTLVEAGVVHDLVCGHPTSLDRIRLFGFPWKHDPGPISSSRDAQNIAVIHKYCWSGEHKYMYAPAENEASRFKLDGYDAAVFGDNHIGFINGRICNCGGLLRRSRADATRNPFVGVLFDDGTIKKHVLDTTADVYTQTDDDLIISPALPVKEFTDGLLDLRSGRDFDFAEILGRYMSKHRTPETVSAEVLRAVEESR